MAGLLKWFKVWTKPLVADVPPELAQCEFGCKVQACTHGKFAGCVDRISCMNAEIAHPQRSGARGETA